MTYLPSTFEQRAIAVILAAGVWLLVTAAGCIRDEQRMMNRRACLQATSTRPTSDVASLCGAP